MEANNALIAAAQLPSILTVAADAVRDFLAMLAPYADDSEHGPFTSLVRYELLWQSVREFRDGREFDAEALMRNGKQPRIEVRGRLENGNAAQVAIIGVPGHFRAAVVAALKPSIECMGLKVVAGGAMTISINRCGVDKALAIHYVGNHFEAILGQMGYTAGREIDAWKTRTLVIADGDGTLYGKPTQAAVPVLYDSPARIPLIQYLEMGGLLLVNSGHDLDCVVQRLLERDAIPEAVRNRILIAANEGAHLVCLTPNGETDDIHGYHPQALVEKSACPGAPHSAAPDWIYVGDEAGEEGNDFPAYEAVGFDRSLCVSMQEMDTLGRGIRRNLIGGAEHGVAAIFQAVVQKARAYPLRPLFACAEVPALAARIRTPLSDLTPAALHEVCEHIMSQLDRAARGQDDGSTLAQEASYVSPTDGTEAGFFLSVDWGGSNLRVKLIELTPGHDPNILQSAEMRFTDQHKSGVIDPFDTIAIQIAQMGLNLEREYRLGFTFAQPVQQERLDCAILRRWVKGWHIPSVCGKDVAGLLQAALDRQGLPHVKVAAVINDAVATHLTVPHADLGLILGTGFTTTMLDERRQIVNLESGGFRFAGLTQTLIDSDIYRNTDPQTEHATEKMVSGAYLGQILRAHLGTLRDQGEFMCGVEYVPFLDAPHQLQREEFECDADVWALYRAIRADVETRLHEQAPEPMSLSDALHWLNHSPLVFQLVDGRVESCLPPASLALFQKVKSLCQPTLCSGRSEAQVHNLEHNREYQKMQRILLTLLYADRMPKDSPDILMTKLLSLTEAHRSVGSLRNAVAICRQYQFLGAASDGDLQILMDAAAVISRRAGRLVAAILVGSLLKQDPDFSRDHIIAVDGSVYEKHPMMRYYIAEGIEELKSACSGGTSGSVEFVFVKDASCLGAAHAVARYK